MILEHWLNLGANSAPERVVHRLGDISNMKSCEKKQLLMIFGESNESNFKS